MTRTCLTESSSLNLLDEEGPLDVALTPVQVLLYWYLHRTFPASSHFPFFM